MQVTLSLGMLVYLLCFVIGGGVGGLVSYYFFPHNLTDTQTITVEKPIVIEKVVTQRETAIQYVPKETIVFIDPKTGQTIIEKEKTDVDVVIPKDTVNVRLNGTPYDFALQQTETQGFVDGKLVLKQNSTVDFDIRVERIVVDNTRHWGAGVTYGTNGVGGALTGPLVGNIDFIVTADKQQQSAGVLLRF